MITMILSLVVLGMCLYLVETYIPMSPPIHAIVRLVVIIFSIVWLLSTFGLINSSVNLR